MSNVIINTATPIRDILADVNGATFVSIDTQTTPTIRKTIDTEEGRESNPHFGRVQKFINGASVMVFQNKTINGYESMVNRRLEQEGKDPSSFQLGPRKWGERLKGLPLVEHKGKLYLEVIFLRPGPAHYTLDGKEVDKSEILGLSPQKEGEQGGLSNKVIIRTFALDSITAIRINHKVYTNITL